MKVDMFRQTVSAMFYAGGEVSELGRSPTRMAEILGCGLLVVANAGVGDVARIIEGYRVGVLVESASADSMDRSLDALAELRTDPELPSRCRQAAEEMFSLERGTEAYRALYNEVLAKGGGSGATPLHSSRNSDGGGPRPAVLNE
jgi:glycosyltransferase involved in cell wall biosynthesis